MTGVVSACGRSWPRRWRYTYWGPKRGLCPWKVRSNNFMEVWPGKPYPMGATYDGAGTNFSLFSEVAERVELCLFDEEGRETRVPMPESTGYVWHAYLPRAMGGQQYGYRVYGPWDPSNGKRCNTAKPLLAPYT